MPRFLARGLQAVIDVGVLSLAYWFAFLFRFEFAIPRAQIQLILVNWPYVVAAQYLALSLFNVPRMAWRYTTMRDSVRAWLALTVATSLVVALRISLPSLTTSNLVYLPLGVIAVDYVLAFVGLVGLRATWRLHNEARARKLRGGSADRK